MGHSSPATTAIYAMFDARKAGPVVTGLGASGDEPQPAPPPPPPQEPQEEEEDDEELLETA